jgi:Virulence factor
MASLTVISWRDIPSQIVVKRGRETAKLMLSHRFQEAIDRAAMRAGKTSSASYIADWARSEARSVGDDLQAEAAAEAERIEARYSEDDLLRLIRAHGVDDTKAAPSTPAAGDA